MSDLYRQRVLILHHHICLILLRNICFGVWSLQVVSVDFVPPNLFDFTKWHLLWNPISKGGECWFCATKYVQFFLSHICFTVWSLQGVSGDFVPPNIFNFAEQHLVWCLISTGSECWFGATKLVLFFWAISALVSDIYREWVLILCHQIYSIFLNNICFGVWSLQAVSVGFVLPNLFHLLTNICFGVWSL